jgi:hypothetical protein
MEDAAKLPRDFPILAALTMYQVFVSRLRPESKAFRLSFMYSFFFFCSALLAENGTGRAGDFAPMLIEAFMFITHILMMEERLRHFNVKRVFPVPVRIFINVLPVASMATIACLALVVPGGGGPYEADLSEVRPELLQLVRMLFMIVALVTGVSNETLIFLNDYDLLRHLHKMCTNERQRRALIRQRFAFAGRVVTAVSYSIVFVMVPQYSRFWTRVAVNVNMRAFMCMCDVLVAFSEAIGAEAKAGDVAGATAAAGKNAGKSTHHSGESRATALTTTQRNDATMPTNT